MTNIEYLTKIIERMIEIEPWIKTGDRRTLKMDKIKISTGTTYFDICFNNQEPEGLEPFNYIFEIGLRYETNEPYTSLSPDDASSYQLIVRDEESFMASPHNIFYNKIYNEDNEGEYEILDLPQGDTFEEDFFCFSTIHNTNTSNMVELYNSVKDIIHEKIFFKVHHYAFKCDYLDVVLKDLNSITEEKIKMASKGQY